MLKTSICSHTSCKKEFTVSPGSTGKYCSLSCSTSYRNILNIENKTLQYNVNPVLCKQCNLPLVYDSRKNKFCNRSCATIFNNSKKDYTVIKTGPAKGFVPTNFAPYTKVSQCIICNKYHPKSGKTCSKQCFYAYMSIQLRGKTGGNTDVNLPGVDCSGKNFYYDSGWEVTLSKSLTDNNIFWERPSKFILSNGRSYTPDFYLPEYGIYLDPKAKRPEYYRKSILKIEMFEKEYNVHCLVISDVKLLSWHHIQTMLLVENYRS